MSASFLLETERLVLREWRLDETDRKAFHRIMSNEKGRKFYPSRLSREQSDQMLQRIHDKSLNEKYVWRAACLKDAEEPIGFTGLCTVTFDARFTPSVEIGWQFLPEHWGNGYATEAARALLYYGFENQQLTEIVSFAVPANVASTKVMERIGMAQDGEFIHPDVSDNHPQLKRHVLYRLTQDQWLQNCAG